MPIELEKKKSFDHVLVTAFPTILCFALVLVIGMSATMGVAFCNDAAKQATDTINAAVEGVANNVYEVFKNAIMPFAGLALGVAAFKLIFGGQRGMEAAFKIILYSCGSVALVFLSPMLVKAFGGWFVSSAGNMSSVNDLFDATAATAATGA